MMGTLLECKDLTKSFSGKTAIDHIDLSIESGHIIGLLGPNGSGIPITKYQCLVLWRNTYIPAHVPILPPKMLTKNNILSEIRHRCIFALLLSSPIIRKPTRFKKIR